MKKKKKEKSADSAGAADTVKATAKSAAAASNDIQILIVIPSYNNKATLRKVVLKAKRTGLNILVVNDGVMVILRSTEYDGRQEEHQEELVIVKVNYKKK